ncbi:ferrous iron transport protein B [Massilibacteroides sp.]|uniref:ferrous iron transport protein B n=1 Tax=Massilibacteroides sp. TaxID=2034766 RepID=UPI00260BEB17|nr:ferrous iron transport protein B [Massilibacteroides sp.]MDD4516770.1 ferrous iron transport protein B [Massilibacteroides sp.]
MRLSELQTGENGIIVKVLGKGAFRKRIIEMGFIRGKSVEVINNAPLRDPIHYKVMGYNVSLRRSDAALIEVVSEATYKDLKSQAIDSKDTPSVSDSPENFLYELAIKKGKTINVALVGNPNCGKTSLFNFASGAHERVGNYSGVTVDAKEAVFYQDDYTFRITDLPGTYSLSCYSPEELYVRKHLNEEHPDIVINVVDASNLERNLYLTSQLIDMDVRTVIALNMYDELEKSGDKFDYEALSRMTGIPIVPTVSKTGEGIEQLFKRVIQVYEEKDPVLRHIHINYGETLEKAITNVRNLLRGNQHISRGVSKRFLAIKLLEGDKEVEDFVRSLPNGNASSILAERNKNTAHIKNLLLEDSETSFTNARYGFIAGALQETFEPSKIKNASRTQFIDLLVTHKLLGFPFFIAFMWVMFEATFRLGDYPMGWIEDAVAFLGDLVSNNMSEGPFKDLLVDGIIAGVGGVIVFLPNILILYLFISFMEDSGYMARAAFIMDKLMHKMGLHGKSFIPLVMGFGCTVPAIMATRTIESRSSRMITMLINPLMSCSARLPVYVLLIGAFFPNNSSLMMLIIYMTGIVLAIIVARIFKRYLFNEEDVPFVMELPPYRMPTAKSIFIHMWEKARQYLRKMGGIILVASIIIWFLGYYPNHSLGADLIDKQIAEIENTTINEDIKNEQIIELEHKKAMDLQRNSYIGQLGRTIQPVLAPLGFDWKISVSILSGMAAKEVVVSTLGVLYTGDSEESQALPERIKQDRDENGELVFSPLVAFSLMLFVLIYFPCIATVAAVIRESGSWKWGGFLILYSCSLAWIVSFIVYQTGTILNNLIG